MSDLVERLRNTSAIPYYAYGDNEAACEAFALLPEAADEIERLRAALERIMEATRDSYDGPAWVACRIAREALHTQNDKLNTQSGDDDG